MSLITRNARFLSREDRDAVFRARNRLKDSSRAKDVYVVVNFLFQLIFFFPLFLGMVMYANEF